MKKRSKKRKKSVGRRKNPTEAEVQRDHKLLDIMHRTGELPGFFVYVIKDNLEIWPWIPEIEEWQEAYPVLKIKLNPPTPKLIKIAQILGLEEVPSRLLSREVIGSFRERKLEQARNYLIRLNGARFKSDSTRTALKYLDKYRELQKLMQEV